MLPLWVPTKDISGFSRATAPHPLAGRSHVPKVTPSLRQLSLWDGKILCPHPDLGPCSALLSQEPQILLSHQTLTLALFFHGFPLCLDLTGSRSVYTSCSYPHFFYSCVVQTPRVLDPWAAVRSFWEHSTRLWLRMWPAQVHNVSRALLLYQSPPVDLWLWVLLALSASNLPSHTSYSTDVF